MDQELSKSPKGKGLLAGERETPAPTQTAPGRVPVQEPPPAIPSEAREEPAAVRVHHDDSRAVDVDLAEEGPEGGVLVLMLDKPDELLVAVEATDERSAPLLVLGTVDPLLVGTEDGSERERDGIDRRGVGLDVVDPGELRLELGGRRAPERRDLNGELSGLAEVLGEESTNALHPAELVHDRLHCSHGQVRVFRVTLPSGC